MLASTTFIILSKIEISVQKDVPLYLGTEFSSNTSDTLLHLWFDQESGEITKSFRNQKLVEFFC